MCPEEVFTGPIRFIQILMLQYTAERKSINRLEISPTHLIYVITFPCKEFASC